MRHIRNMSSIIGTTALLAACSGRDVLVVDERPKANPTPTPAVHSQLREAARRRRQAEKIAGRQALSNTKD